MQEGQSLDGQAALFLLAGLIDSMDRASPGVNAWIDKYLVESLSRRHFSDFERDAIGVARDMLTGLRGE
jgi:hypothetical protein